MLSLKRPGHEKRNLETGQTPLEIIGIAVVLVALLLLVLVTTYNKNMQAKQLLSISENSIQCTEMAATVTRFYNNRANTAETVHISEHADLNRVEGFPGSIKVGKVTCEYVGSVQKSTGESDTDLLGTNLGGVPLPVGTWCIEKQADTNVVIKGGECP